MGLGPPGLIARSKMFSSHPPLPTEDVKISLGMRRTWVECLGTKGNEGWLK
jgi:hypothetical protein